MEDIICLSSGSDEDSDLEVISSYNEVKEDAVPFIRTEWLPVTPVLINITEHKLSSFRRRYPRRVTCSPLEVIDLSDDSTSDDIDSQLQNSSQDLPSKNKEDKHVDSICSETSASFGKSQQSESQTDNLGGDVLNSGCYGGSSVEPVFSRNPFTDLNIQKTGNLLHQDTNWNTSLKSSGQLSVDHKPLEHYNSNDISSKSLVSFKSSEVLNNSDTDVTQNITDAQLSRSSPAKYSTGADRENEENLDSSQKWDGSVHSPYSLDSPYYCPSEVDAYEFSDESNQVQQKDNYFTTSYSQQSPQTTEILSDVHHTGSVSITNPSKDKGDTMNICEKENIHKMSFTQAQPKPSPVSTPTSLSPPCSPELISIQNQSSKPNSPTSTEILASDTVAYSPYQDAESSPSTPLSLSISQPQSPAYSERAESFREFRGIDSDAVSLEDSSVNLWETSSNADDEDIQENVPSDLYEESTQDRQHICLAQYKKLRQRLGGTVPDTHEHEDEDEHYGAAEPLCRQSLSLVYTTIEENYPEGTLQLLSDFIQPRYYPPVDITAHLLKGIFLDPQSPDVLAVEAYNLLMKIQRYHPADTSTVAWDWELLTSIMEEQDDTRKLQMEVRYMLLQYVLQVLEDDFQFKLQKQCLTQTIAKTMLSCDQRFSHVRDIINWMVTAAKQSVNLSKDVENPKKDQDNCLKIVLSLQKMLTLALEVDRTPTCSSNKISEVLFQSLNSMSPCRQIRLLLLSTLESKLLRCKLLEMLLDEACSQKRPPPMSLSLLLHYLQTSTLSPDPSDGAESWRKWDELLQLLWMLMLSYEEVVTGHLRYNITERFGFARTPIWTRNDQVTRSAVQEAAEAFLSHAEVDIGHAVPMEIQESLSHLQEHITDMSSVISSH